MKIAKVVLMRVFEVGLGAVLALVMLSMVASSSAAWSTSLLTLPQATLSTATLVPLHCRPPPAPSLSYTCSRYCSSPVGSSSSAPLYT